MTPRRIFWVLFSAAAVWFVLGTRIVRYVDIAQGQPSFLQRIHLGLGGIFHWSLTPVSYAGTIVQTQFARLAPLPGEPDGVPQDLKKAFEQLRRENEKLTADIAEIKRDFGTIDLVKRRFPNTRPLLVKVIGGPLAMNVDTCVINAGSHQGVLVELPVYCNYSMVGRIIHVGPINSDVQLVTDPRVKIGAFLRRRVGDEVRDIVTCVMIGKGQGVMSCNNIPQKIARGGTTELVLPPEPGDRLYINDPSWPAYSQQVEFGVVTEVGREGLYYTIKARASEDVNNPRGTSVDPKNAYDGLRVLLPPAPAAPAAPVISPEKLK